MGWVRVLLVEDEVRLAKVVCEGLEAQGVSVDIEHAGDTGLWRAREGTYDVIVLDIMLPKLNGYQVCRQIRDDENWTPILMLTAKDGEWDEAEALDTGADDFLTKPFSFVVLLARLRALARRGAAERPVVLSVGSLTMNPASRKVARDGTAIELTPREFDLLEVLMRASGDPVSKREILDRVWGIDGDHDPNSVEVYVRYLRRKCDIPFGTETIRTQRGVGYRVDDQ